MLQPSLVPPAAAMAAPQLATQTAMPRLNVANPDNPFDAPEGVKLRAVGDVNAIRESVYDSVLRAAAEMPEVVGNQHTLRLTDLHYAEDDPEFNAADEKKAILSGSSLSRRLRGTWQLVDNTTGEQLAARKATVANVPAILRDGSFLRNGTRYAMGYQQRLKPGAYARYKKSGEPEVHVNAAAGSGRSHRYVLEPETGLFHVHIEHAKIPLVPLLQTMGVTREQIENAWGKELADKNFAKQDAKAMNKLYERFVSKHEQSDEDKAVPERVAAKIQQAISKIKLDPEVVDNTLGRASETLDGDLMLRGTSKALRMLQGQEDADDRDNLAFASYHGAADIFAERFMKDYGKFRRELLYKAGRKGNLDSLPSGALDKYINAAIFRSGLAQGVEDVNPIEIAATINKITRFGEGGLPDSQSAPAESRDVHPSQFGYIDGVLTPESLRIGIDGFLARNAMIGSDNKLYTKMINNKTGSEVVRSPDKLLRSSVSLGDAPMDGYEMVVVRGRLRMLPKGVAEYSMPNMEDSFSVLGNMVPMKGNMFGQRASMGGRMSITGDSNVLIQREDGSGYFGPICDYVWQSGDTSLSIDKTTHALCWKPVLAKMAYLNTKRLFKVKLKSGRSVVATSDHSCVTLDDFGNLQKIATDKLQRHWPVPSAPIFDTPETFNQPWIVPDGNKHNAYSSVAFELTRDLGWIFGLYAAEGYGNYRKVKPEEPDRVTFANINKEIQERSKAFFAAYGVNARISTGRPDKQDDRIVTNWKQLAIKLKQDFGDGAYNKKLPGWVLFAPREFREGLLAGYLDGDGIVARSADRSVRIGGGSRSKQLRDALVTLCGTLGIATTISEQWVDTGPGGSRVKQFEFNVRKSHIEKLPAFTYPVKQEKLGEAEWSGTRSGDWLPLFAAARCLYRRFTRRGTTAYSRADQHLMGNLSRKEVCETFGDNVNWITRGWAESGVWWERVGQVKEVEATGSEYEYVYDLDLADNVFWVDGVFVHNSSQAMSLETPQAPWVQTGVPGDADESFEEQLGKQLGAIRAEERGRVVELGPDHVVVKYAGGREQRHVLDNNRPGARKSVYHQTPVVELGQEVEPNQLLVKSNYVDDNGVAALGTNARTALMAWPDAWEDGIVVSQSFADRTRMQQAYKYKIQPGEGEKVDKRGYLQLFGNRYKAEQLKNIGDDGVIKVGTVVKEGDPLMLGMRKREGAKTRVHKQSKMDWGDSSVRWDHAHEGVVTDVFHSDKGSQVVVKTAKPLEEGDKLAGRFGNKGVITVKPDSEMPQDAEGNSIELIVSPLAVPSRGNSSFPLELLLGKIAAKRGAPYKIKDFKGTDLQQMAMAEAEANGVSDTETLIDPKTGRKIPDVLTGQSFVMSLHHMASSKSSARGLGTYSSDDTPAKGGEEGAQAKRYSGQMAWAGMSHGAYNMSREATLLRGVRNDDYWNAFMGGEQIAPPKVSPQYDAFIARLQASGINPLRSGTKTQLMAMIDADVDDLAGDRIVTSPDTVDVHKDLKPIPNGLFDPRLFGDGTRFAAIQLSEPSVNPAFEEPIRRMLGLTEKEFREVLGGKKELGSFGSGPEGLKKRLDSMDIDQEITKAREAIAGTRKVARDEAVKRLKYLKSLKDTDTRPSDLMITKVPVLPPRLRPISKLGGKGGVVVSDPNFLYRELMFANEVVNDLKGTVDDLSAERLAVYDAHRALVGLTDPASRELRQRKVKGLIKQITGDNPKASYVQRRLISGNVDTVGRGVIAPDTSLDMDSFGLPENLAFEMYTPYIVRNMSLRGIPRVAALEHLKNRDDVARRSLLAEIDKRPVMLSRAPILHKYGDIALQPKLIKGDTIRLNPLVYGPMGGDNDGDAVNLNVPHSREAVAEAFERMLPSKMLLATSDFKSPMFKPTQDLLLGLHIASRPARKGLKTRYFGTLADAKAALSRGDIDIDTPVKIGDRPS